MRIYGNIYCKVRYNIVTLQSVRIYKYNASQQWWAFNKTVMCQAVILPIYVHVCKPQIEMNN